MSKSNILKLCEIIVFIIYVLKESQFDTIRVE